MLKNYFKVAWRNLLKNKTFSFINIFGLSIGLTCCMLISIYIVNEYSYDQHHVNGDRIYQLGTDFMSEGESSRAANTSGALGPLMQREFPEIEKTARMMRLFQDDKTLVGYKDPAGNRKVFYEKQGYIADSSFFQVLTYDFKEGNPQTALLQPASIVVSETLADKLFGKTGAVGKLISIGSSTHGAHDFTVTGVFKEPATPTHIDANFIMSFRGGAMNEFANDNPSLINNNMFYTYLLLKKGAPADKLAKKFPAFVDRHLGAELKARGGTRKYFLSAISDVYLHSGIEENVTPGGSKTSLFILGSIALLTLLIACINFMNLSTASSAKRAAEVGVRKVLGAEKRSLLNQFLGESVMMSLLAMIVALALAFLLRPFFEQLSGKALLVSFQQHALLVAGFVLLALFTGLFSGLYPAVYLSSFKPIKVLKGKFSNSLAAVSLRKGMVVFQFVISIALIGASVVIAAQMKYLRTKELGFQKDQQVIIPLRTPAAKASIAAFKAESANNPAIRSIGSSMYYPGISNPQDWLMHKEGKTMNEAKKVYINMVDDNFLQTLGVKLVAGRLFSSQFPADTLTRFVINEEAVTEFGFASAEDAVGKWLAFDFDGQQSQFTIVGVVKNFHFKDLHASIEPFAFRLYNGAPFSYMIAHASTKEMDKTIASLGNSWKKLNPNEPFEYSFLDLDFQKNYEADNRQSRLISAFTIIAIIISCLGLFALATFTAEQRTKEIGIRKVLGASISSLVGLLSKDFLKLVIIAAIISFPLAWYAMNQWLQNFHYKITISWQVFAVTALVALMIAFLTVSFQAIKTALSNPVRSLRTE